MVPTDPSPAARSGTDGPPEAPLPQDAPEAVRAAANGGELTGEQEKTAVDWLLGATFTPKGKIEVQFDTPAGLLPMVMFVQALDPSVIQRLENEHRKDESPLGELEELPFNAAICGEAVYRIESGGRTVDPGSSAFRGEVPTKALAFEGRFRKQGGLLAQVSGQVRELSGYSSDRVGRLQRVLVDASGN